MFLIILMLAILVTGFILLRKGLRMKIPDSTETETSYRDRSYQDNTWKKRQKFALTVSGAALIGFWVLVVFLKSIINVPPGTVYVGQVLGVVQRHPHASGPQVVNPLTTFTPMSVRRLIIEFDGGGQGGGGDVVAVSSDNLPMDVDVTYAFRLNPRYAWWVYRSYGNQEAYIRDFVAQAARSATRSATSHFTSAQATTTSRDELARRMEADFRGRLIEDMVRQGLPQEDAERVFVVLPVQLRRVLPPARVQTAMADRAAAIQDLERQRTLTLIAEQEAQRRAQEGAGVRELFEELPSHLSAQEISVVLRAMADKERADAQMLAVRSGRVSVMVMDGGNPAITPPARE